MNLRIWLVILTILSTLTVSSVTAEELDIRNPSEPLVPVEVGDTVKKSYSVKKDEFILSSIFIGFGKKMATINGKEYQEGDSFGRYLVKAINSDHVVIDTLGKKKILALYAANKTGFIIK